MQYLNGLLDGFVTGVTLFVFDVPSEQQSLADKEKAKRELGWMIGLILGFIALALFASYIVSEGLK